MAKQMGIFPLLGTIGNVTFARTKNGYIAKNRSSIDGERIAIDPAFQGLRKQMSEFGRACKGASLIYQGFKDLIKPGTSTNAFKRLVRRCTEVLKEDGVNEWGQRTMQDGKPGLLEGFPFNGDCPISSSLHTAYSVLINRVAGTVSFAVPSFIPEYAISAPLGATHYSVGVAGGEFDLVNSTSVIDTKESAILPLDNAATSSLSLVCNVTAASTEPIVAVLGIVFYKEVNGTAYMLKDKAFNTFGIIGVDA